jgi:hypothetical protein
VNPLEKLKFAFGELDQIILPGGLGLGTALWLLRTLRTSNAQLLPSQFGDGSPLSFNRTDEPREYWSLVVLAAAVSLVGFTVSALRAFD